jgi:hypothetical protein
VVFLRTDKKPNIKFSPKKNSLMLLFSHPPYSSPNPNIYGRLRERERVRGQDKEE